MKIEIQDKVEKGFILKGLEKCPKLVRLNKKRPSIFKLKEYFYSELKRDLFIIATLFFVYISMLLVSIVGHKELILIYLFCFPFVLALLGLPSILRVRSFKKRFSVVKCILKHYIKASIEVYEFGLKLYYYDKLIFDISWGNIQSIEIYDDIIFINCKIEKYSFFINSRYAKELTYLVKSQGKKDLIKDKRSQEAKYV